MTDAQKPALELVTLMEKLAKARAEATEAAEYAKSCKAIVETLRLEVQEELETLGLSTAKTSDGSLTAFFSKRKSGNVYNAEEFAGWLVENNMDPLQYFNPDNAKAKSIAESYLKEKKEEIPGVEINEKVILSLKDNKPKKQKVDVELDQTLALE